MCAQWQAVCPRYLRATSTSGCVTHLVRDFDKEAEALRGLQEQSVGDVLAEVLGFRAGFHFKCLQRDEDHCYLRVNFYFLLSLRSSRCTYTEGFRCPPPLKSVTLWTGAPGIGRNVCRSSVMLLLYPLCFMMLYLYPMLAYPELAKKCKRFF